MSSIPNASVEEAAAGPAPEVPPREEPPAAARPVNERGNEYDSHSRFDSGVEPEAIWVRPGRHDQNMPREAPQNMPREAPLATPQKLGMLDGYEAVIDRYLKGQNLTTSTIEAVKGRLEKEETEAERAANKRIKLSADEERARKFAILRKKFQTSKIKRPPTRCILPENKPAPSPGIESPQQEAMQSDGVAAYHDLYEEPESTEGMEIDVAALMPEWNDGAEDKQ